MRKRIGITLLAIVSMGLYGCSTAEVGGGVKNDSGNPSEGPSAAAGYIAIRLSEAEEQNGTGLVTSRSIHKDYDDEYEHYEWFNKGTEDERAVTDNAECNRILLFNADHSFYGSAKMEKTAQENVYLGHKPASIYVTTPTSFLAILNGDPERLDALEAALATADDALLTALNYLNESAAGENPESIAQYEGYFTMSSVIYRGSDNLVAGVTVKEDFQFYDTIEEALLPENLLRLYVERVLAKFTVRVQNGEVSFENGDAIVVPGSNRLKVRVNYAVEDGQGKDITSPWSVNLVNWGMNGTEHNTYMFKTLVQNPTEYPWNIDAEYYSSWNDLRLYRSYWAVDENYNTGIYPDQYRVALDVDGVESATTNTVYSDSYDPAEGLTRGDYTLIYRSYNAFDNRSDNKYSVENTFDAVVFGDDDLDTRPYLRCGTHIILTAQLLIDEIDGDVDRSAIDEQGFLKGVEDKFFSNGLYWSRKALIQQSVATLVSSSYYNSITTGIKDVLNGGMVEFINNDEANPLDEVSPIVCGDGTPLTIDNAEEYFDFAPAFIQGGDGWVTLHLKEGKTIKAKHMDGTLSDISTAQLVSYIYRFTNLAKHYNEGRMYYALPIKHNIDSKYFDSDSVVTGDYGVVRNHWYRLTINSILMPGTPVDDPDQPIIPNNEPNDKSLGVEIEVIPWHIVDINVDKLR